MIARRVPAVGAHMRPLREQAPLELRLTIDTTTRQPPQTELSRILQCSVPWTLLVARELVKVRILARPGHGDIDLDWI